MVEKRVLMGQPRHLRGLVSPKFLGPPTTTRKRFDQSDEIWHNTCRGIR